MADPTTPAAAPAVPAVSPAVARAFAPMDSMVELDVYGRKQTLPLSEVVREAQKSLAGDNKLEQAKGLIAMARADEEYARSYRNLETDLKTDPQRALQNLARRYGVQYNPDDTAQPHGAEGGRAPETPNTRALEERMGRLESAQTRVQFEADVEATLDRFLLYKQDQFSRDGARLMMLAARNVNPNASIDAVAQEYHSHRVRELGAAATATLEQRVQSTQQVVNVPANIGAPDLAAIPAGSAKGLKDGSMRENMIRGLRALGQATGIAPGT